MFTHLHNQKQSRSACGWSAALSKLSAPPGVANLKMYVAHARLPPMLLGPGIPRIPPDGHKTHRNTLSVRAERWRRLEGMEVINPKPLDVHALQFMNTYMFAHELHVDEPDMTTGLRLTLPCDGLFYVTDSFVGRPSDQLQFCQWVLSYPLATLRRVMHLTFPQTQEWDFSTVTNDLDDDIVTCITWDRQNDDRSIQSAVAVIMQPPWIVSSADLEAFVNCRTLPHPTDIEGEDDPEYTSKERMWAKTWDFCARRGCHWFVVTTYWGWVFGVFTKGRTRAFVTPLRNFDVSSPNILQYLIYWFGSAMEISGALAIPEVTEPVSSVNNGIEDIPLAEEFAAPPPSESTWVASSQRLDVISTADTEEVMQMLMMPGDDESVIMPPAVRPTGAAIQDAIMNWQMNGTSSHVPGLPLSAFSPPSELTSAVTVSSAESTATDLPGERRGGVWQSTRPPEHVNAIYVDYEHYEGM